MIISLPLNHLQLVSKFLHTIFCVVLLQYTAQVSTKCGKTAPLRLVLTVAHASTALLDMSVHAHVASQAAVANWTLMTASLNLALTMVYVWTLLIAFCASAQVAILA